MEREGSLGNVPISIRSQIVLQFVEMGVRRTFHGGASFDGASITFLGNESIQMMKI